MSRSPIPRSPAHDRLSLAFPPEAAHGCAEDIEPRPLFRRPTLTQRFSRWVANLFRRNA